jgi:uncharacterized protein DUF4190
MHVACPHCGNVHDVTNLSPGSTVRCACGGYFQVPPKQQADPSPQPLPPTPAADLYPPPPQPTTTESDSIPSAHPVQDAPPTATNNSPTQAFPATKPTPGVVIASLILGCLSFLTCGIFMSIPGLILGYSGRKQIDEHPDQFEGRGAATAGIVLNWVNIAFSFVAIVIIIIIAVVAGLEA